ncbi:hypothetical protein [Yersinia phage vB_Yru_GN1]|uniref:Uncharacterized protein n=1 Tax=Yersinia phage vB_Yru_GN1 TaxID=3074381 RepID=A0AA86J0G4_9CAUD|nr:hypothetical protein [Yersinia phage vB_Yru_GN1]
MIRIHQEIVDPKIGDCLRACVASILELPITLVPNFVEYQHRYQKIFMDYMRTIGGYDSVFVTQIDKNNPYKLNVHHSFMNFGTIKGVTIASIRSKKYPGGSHAVLINNKFRVVFDPTTDLDYSQEGRNLSGSDDLYGYWIFKY